jgi:Helicase conserved C-terminal domain
VSLTAETNKRTYHLVAEGHFQLVYATPEILIKRTSRFRNIVMTRNGNKFTSNLLSIAIDEAHIPLLWGHFRKEYEELPILRNYFPSASVVALSATFSRKMRRHIIDTMSMRDPLCILQSIRRRNILKMVSIIRQPGYADLNILLPESLSHPSQIPRTLIYHDSIDGGIAIARYLRERLPPQLREDNKQKEIIRVYAGYLPDDVRSLYEHDIQYGPARIMICTDACGMGINLKGILRVVQWKVKSNIGIEGIDQRFGRAGRDSNLQAIAIAFVDPSLATPFFRLSSGSDDTTAEDDDNEDDVDDEVEDEQERSEQATEPSKIPVSIPDLLFRLTTPVTSSNKAEVESFLAEIAAFSNGSLSSRRYFHQTWYKQDAAALWFVNVAQGCRHRVLMALFDDPGTFDDESEYGFWDEMTMMCCDICVKAAVDRNLITQIPVIHGIPLSMGLAFQTEIQRLVPSINSSDDVMEVFPSNPVPISKSRIDKVKDALRAWRKKFATPIVPPHRLLSDKTIGKIGNAVKTKEVTETVICETLEQLGISSKRSAITKHIPDLVELIAKNLSRTLDEQPHARILELPERPLAPPSLPFMITEAQIAHDMLQEQATVMQEAERAKESRKRKRKADHSRGTRQRAGVVLASQGRDIGSVLHLGASQSLITSGHLFPLMTKRTFHHSGSLKRTRWWLMWWLM